MDVLLGNIMPNNTFYDSYLNDFHTPLISFLQLLESWRTEAEE